MGYNAVVVVKTDSPYKTIEDLKGKVVARTDPLSGSGYLIPTAAFRAMASRVKERTGQKGRALFHPIRVALTGEAGGPELDLSVPAIDRGAALPPDAGVAPVASNRERARAFAAAIA